MDKRIVFTNGCFDLIHPGHIYLFNEASKLGDILIVGINSNKSFKEYKKREALFTQEQRIEMLDALSSIDLVIPFDEPTPYELIRVIKPHILVKGGDWGLEDIIGVGIVEKVVSIPFKYNISTTKIRNKIKGIDYEV